MVESIPSVVADRVNERVGHASHDQANLIGVLVDVADEKMLRGATRIAEEQGWRLLWSDTPFSRLVRAEAFRRGMPELASAPFLACREAVGRPVDPRFTDSTTESLLTSLRGRFGEFRSFSMSFGTRADDPVSLMMTGRPAEAELLLTERAADAADAPAWLLLSDAALHQGHLETAERAARTAVRLAPDMAESWHALAEVELARSRPTDALVAAVRATALSPSFVSAHRVKLICARMVGDTGRAAEAEAHLRHLGYTPNSAAAQGSDN